MNGSITEAISISVFIVVLGLMITINNKPENMNMVINKIPIKEVVSIDLDNGKLKAVDTLGTVFDLKFNIGSQFKIIESDKDFIEYEAYSHSENPEKVHFSESQNHNITLHYSGESPIDKIVIIKENKEMDVMTGVISGYLMYKALSVMF